MALKSTSRHQSREPKKQDMTAAFLRKNRSKNPIAQVDVDSLFTASQPTNEPIPDTQLVALGMIELDSGQPRKFSKDYAKSDEHRELVATVKEHGILQPVLLRPIKPDKHGNPRAYRLVAGERRYRAASDLKLPTLPAIVRDYSEVQMVEIQLIENGARKDLNDSETANAIRRLATEFGYTQAEIAKRTGKGQGDISRLLKVFNDPVLREYLEHGKITYSQARELVTVKSETAKADIARDLAAMRQRKQSVPLSSLRAATQTGQSERLKDSGITAPSHLPTSPRTAPSERGNQLLSDLRHGVSVWSGVVVQAEETPGGIAVELARDINAEIVNMQSQIERLRKVIPAAKAVRLVS